MLACIKLNTIMTMYVDLGFFSRLQFTNELSRITKSRKQILDMTRAYGYCSHLFLLTIGHSFIVNL